VELTEYVLIQIVDLVVKAENKVQMKVHVVFHATMIGGVMMHLHNVVKRLLLVQMRVV
tara:strand:+ start:314 stop:487 length:174 start_codon:yes stop_codon:yes gene_type:complete